MKVSINELVNGIHDQIKSSYLDFSIQETPYSSYITIRKKIQRNASDDNFRKSVKNIYKQGEKQNSMDNSFELKEEIMAKEKENNELQHENDRLIEDIKNKGKDIAGLLKECEDLRLESKIKHNEIIKIKKESHNLDLEKTELERKLLSSNQALEKKHKKEIHDMEKKYKMEIEVCDKEIEVLNDFKNKKVSEEREKKRLEKKMKKKDRKSIKQFDNEGAKNKINILKENESSSSSKKYLEVIDDNSIDKSSRNHKATDDLQETLISSISLSKCTTSLTESSTVSPNENSSNTTFFSGKRPFEVALTNGTNTSSSVSSLISSFEVAATTSSVSSTLSSEYGFGYPRAAPSIDWDSWPYG